MTKKQKDTATPLRRLMTAKDVVDALGGIEPTCRMTGADFKTVYHWMGRSDFPARFHDMMTRRLRRLGYRAPARLWNQTEEKKAA